MVVGTEDLFNLTKKWWLLAVTSDREKVVSLVTTGLADCAVTAIENRQMSCVKLSFVYNISQYFSFV